jgi:hypothetical protein
VRILAYPALIFEPEEVYGEFIRQEPEPPRCQCGGTVELSYTYTGAANNPQIKEIEMEFRKFRVNCPSNCTEDFNRGDPGAGKLLFKCPSETCEVNDANILEKEKEDAEGNSKCGIEFRYTSRLLKGSDPEIKTRLDADQVVVPKKITAKCDFTEIDITFIEYVDCTGAGGCAARSELPVKFAYKDSKITDIGIAAETPETDLGGGRTEKKLFYSISCDRVNTKSGKRHECPRAESTNCGGTS